MEEQERAAAPRRRGFFASRNEYFTAEADRAGQPPIAKVEITPRLGMTLLQTLLLTAFPILVILAALTDVTSFTIPNRISILLILIFVPAALALGRPVGEIGVDAAVFVAALLAGMAMFALGWIGGGDAKLLAAASLWLGVTPMPVFLIVTALAGGALAVLLMNVRSSWVQPYLASAPAWLARLATPGADVPYGVAIATGALAAFPQTSLVHALHGSF